MPQILTQLVGSFGLKRKIAALLQLLAGIAAQVPELTPFHTILINAAAAFGATGATQAAVKKTLDKVPLSSLTSIVSLLLVVSASVPALAPYTPIIQKIASALSLLAAGSMVSGGKG